MSLAMEAISDQQSSIGSDQDVLGDANVGPESLGDVGSDPDCGLHGEGDTQVLGTEDQLDTG